MAHGGRRRVPISAFTLILALTFLFPTPASAATITVDTLDDELNSDGDCSLREAIQAANTDSSIDNCGAGSGADMITVGFGTFQLSVTGNGEEGNQTGDLDIIGDVNITGMGIGGTAVNAIGQDRGFDVHAGTVVLSGLKVQNGSVSTEPDDGGNIRNSAALTLTDVRVEDGTATGAGGGIFNAPNATLIMASAEVTSAPTGNRASAGGGLSNGGDATISTTTFSGNSALSGGSGGGVQNSPEGTMTIDASTLSGNDGGVNGGGVLNAGTLDITNTSVVNNTAADHPGVANDGNLTITSGSTINGNTATGGGCGGGVWNTGDITIDGSTIDSNTHQCGAGFFNTGSGTLTNSSVTNNTATSGGPAGIGNDGDLTITNATISGNDGSSFGGGIANFGSMAIEDSTISQNTAGSGGGGIGDNGTSTITNSTIDNNSAGSTGCCGGGGLEVGGSGSTTLNGVTVRDNNSAKEAGGIFVFGDLTLVNTMVTGNTAAQIGGGIHVDSGATLSMTGGEVTGNDAFFGGGISSEGPCVPCGQPTPGTATLEGVAVDNNTTDHVGGGLLLFNGTDVRLSNSTVSFNQALDSGGGIANGDSTLTLDGSTVSGNIAVIGPGGIDNDGSLTVSNSTITGNTQTGGCCGGGLGNRGNATIDGSTVSSNTAENGAGIYNTGSLKLSNSTIDSNTSTCCGGGLSNEHSGTATLDNVTLSDNSTGGSGGGIYNFLSGALTLKDSRVTGNDGNDGGGIFNGDGGALSIIRTEISGNTAVEKGGGIESAPYGNTPTLTVEDSTISGNSAAQGGGIHSEGTLTVEGSTLSGNMADGGAGLQNVGSATVVNSTISANSATVNGGAIDNLPDGTVALRNVTVSGNSGASGPGLANGTGAVATLKNTILANSVGGGDCEGNVTSQGYNLIEDPTGCTIGGDTTGNLTGLDPMLGPLANNGGPTRTHALLFGSLAIDAGSPSCPPPATDQRGLTRPQGTACDMGSYESSSANLALTKTDPPGRAPTGRDLPYTLTVVNNGPDSALDVTVIDQLPPSVTFVSAIPSQGICGESGGTVTCNLGTIASGGMATIEIIVKPTVPGTITNTASVSASTPDPNGGNNADSESTSVCRITSRKSSIPCP